MAHLQSPTCRLFGIMATDAPVAVLLRRGPTNHVELIRWDTANDVFECGQWFYGRIYERRCDLSPDGQFFVYFAAKHTTRQLRSGYTDAWTAISRPPYFTALTLWPKGDCWDGGGWFGSAPRRQRRGLHLHLNHPGAAATHPDHPAPKFLRVETNPGGRGEDIPVYNDILLNKGWRRPAVEDAHAAKAAWLMVSKPPGSAERVWAKSSPDGRLILRMELEDVNVRKPGGPLHFGFSLWRTSDGDLLDVLEAQWAEWDQRGRLVYSRSGKLFAAQPRDGSLDAIELADFSSDKPTRIVAPDWATRW